MSSNIPPFLFRFWSAESAGGLESGKFSRRQDPHSFTEAGLLEEFEKHKILDGRTPTAFVSTTCDFLRALHGAFRKIWAGEDPRKVKIAFFTTRTDAQTRIYHARQLALQTGISEEEAKLFETEYIFLWRVPDDNVLHIVSMDVVVERGFTIPRTWCIDQSRSNLSDLRKAIKKYGYQLSPFERGYLCGSAACTFGIRAPVHEIALQLSLEKDPETYHYELIDRAIKEAIQNRMITFAEDLDAQDELDCLMFELSCLEDTHDEIVMEIGWELQSCCQNETLEALLASEEAKIIKHRRRITEWIETAYLRLGL